MAEEKTHKLGSGEQTTLEVVGATPATPATPVIESGAERARRAVAAAAEVANDGRLRLVATLDHEIRMPMNMMLGMIHLAQERVCSPATMQDYLEKIEASSKSLLGVLDNVLDLARIDAAVLTMAQAPFSLRALAGSMDALLGGERNREVTFRTDLADDLPRFVVGDIARIQQVLINLLDNAVKATRQGEITLAIEVLERQSDRVVLRISVRDTGPEPFRQAQRAGPPSYAGIGLDVSTRLVELMGGTLEVESVPGEGTACSVILPLAITDQTPLMDSTTTHRVRDSSALHGLRVLLVEDSPINQEVFEEFLQGLGIEVVIASDGREAVDRVTREVFDVVLMDLQMPIVNGYDATREIRKLYDDTQLPIVAMSADVLEKDKRECFRAGMNDHVAKPFDPETLAGVLAFWSGRSDARHQTSTGGTDERALLAPEQAMRRINGDQGVYRKLLAMFLEQHERMPAEVRELMVAHEDKQMKAVAHRLSSEATQLGLLRLGRASASLDAALRGQKPDVIRARVQELIDAFVATVPEINKLLSKPWTLPPPRPLAMPIAEAPCELLPSIRKIGQQLAEHKLDALSALTELENSIASAPVRPELLEVSALAGQLKFVEAAALLERLAAILHRETIAHPYV